MSEKNTVKLKRINIKNFSCPICNTIGEYETDNNEETYCIHCGCIIDSPYPYTAGIRYYTISDFITIRENKRKEERWKRKWKKTISQPMQHG